MDGHSRLLIVEDDPYIRIWLAEVLAGLGYDILTADDGVEGLALARREHPDLIVTDYAMPGLTGVELVRAVRADPQLAGISIIVLSALSWEPYPRIALEAGCDVFLGKPVDLNVLEDMVRALLAPEHPPAARQQRPLQRGPALGPA